MRTYLVFSLSGVLTVLALAVIMVLKGGWEAADAGLMVAAGMVFGLSFIALLVAGERTSAAPRT